MVKKISLQLKASLVYILSGLLTKGLSFITIPIFTRLLSVEQVGIITNFTSWQSILLTITTLSLGTGAFNVAMVEFPNDRNGYISSMIMLSFMATAVFFIAFLVANELIVKWLQIDFSLILIMFIGFFFAPMIDYYLGKCRYEYKYISMLIVTVIISIGSTVSAIVGVIVASKLGYTNLAEVKIIMTIIPTCIIGLILMVVEIAKGRTCNFTYIKFALKINLPITIHSLAKHILDVSDRTMITKLIGDEAAGIYGTLYSISSIVLILWNAINASLIPYVFDKIKNNEGRILKYVLFGVLLLFSIMSIGIAIVAPEVVRLLATEQYYKNVNIIPPIAAGIYLTALYTIFSNILLYYKQSVLIMLSTCIAAIVNIVLNYVFIPKIGMVAASYTTLISYILLTVILFIVLVKKKELPFAFGALIGLSIITVTCTILLGFLYDMTIIRYSIVGIVCVIGILFRKKIYELYKTVVGNSTQKKE